MSEKQIDALFRRIVQIDAEEESKKLTEQRPELPSDTASELSRLRFDNMLDRELNDGTAKKKRAHTIGISRTAKKVIIAAAVIIVVSFGLMMTSEAVRDRITQFIVSLFPGYAEVGLDNIEELQTSEKTIYELSYIPDGYRLVSGEHELGQQLRYYKSEEEYFMFNVNLKTAVSQLNTENATKVENIMVNGEQGLLIVEDGYAQIAWSNEQYLFHIGGTLTAEEILKIANGVTMTRNYPKVMPDE